MGTSHRPLRRILESGRVEDGLAITAGERFLTATDRATTPFPGQQQERYRSAWLIENALAEAHSRGDHFNQLIFGAERFSKSGELPNASRDAMLLYLFGTPVLPVPSPFVKDMGLAFKGEPSLNRLCIKKSFQKESWT